MRCVIVNGAILKADTACAYCRNKIGESYTRAIGSRLVYCGYGCYAMADKASMPPPGYRASERGVWTRSS
jgi:hypothetical protein